MANMYLAEAFSELQLLEEEVFDVTVDGAAGLQDFISDDNVYDEMETIIDPLAETEEELQDSYIGKAILDCTICQSKIYKDASEVVLNGDETLANVGEVCPYCQSSDGYKVIGQVAEFNPNAETEVEAETTDGEEATIDIETTGEKGMEAAEAAMDEFTKDEEDLDEALKTPEGLRKLNKKAAVEEDIEVIDEACEGKKSKKRSLKESLVTDLPQDVFEQVGEYLTGDGDGELFDNVRDAYNAQIAIENLNIPGLSCWIGYPDRDDEFYGSYVWLEFDYDNELNETITSKEDEEENLSLKAQMAKHAQPDPLEEQEEEKLEEDLENVKIETDKEVITVSSEPKAEDTFESTGEEMIAPIEPEVEAEFQSEVEEEEEPTFEPEYTDIEIDEFEENDFDELGEKYLRRVYENVKSYKTVSGSVKGNTLTLEGIITFKSGKEAKTNFKFEAKTATKTGKLKLIGENKQFAKGAQAFTLTGRAEGKKLIAESLTYNYRGKDAVSGKSQRLYGTVSKRRV
jgi:hypothetical protein